MRVKRALLTFLVRSRLAIMASGICGSGSEVAELDKESR